MAKDNETRKGMTDNEEMGKGHRKDRGLTNVAKDNATKKGKKQDEMTVKEQMGKGHRKDREQSTWLKTTKKGKMQDERR